MVLGLLDRFSFAFMGQVIITHAPHPLAARFVIAFGVGAQTLEQPEYLRVFGAAVMTGVGF